MTKKDSNSDQDQRTTTIRELGLLGIKTVITLNSGALVLLLTIVSQLNADASYRLNICVVKYAGFLFILGLAFTFIAVGVTYIVGQTRKPSEGAWFIFLMCAPTILSAVAFLAGCLYLLYGIEGI